MAFGKREAADTRSPNVLGTWMAGDLIPSYTSAPPVICRRIEDCYDLAGVEACATVQANLADHGFVIERLVFLLGPLMFAERPQQRFENEGFG